MSKNRPVEHSIGARPRCVSILGASSRRRLTSVACVALVGLSLCPPILGRSFDIQIDFADASQFSQDQLTALTAALEKAENLWEMIVLGRQGGDGGPVVFPITVFTANDGLAAASPGSMTDIGGFTMATRGSVWVNPDAVLTAQAGFDFAPGVSVLDELLAHELAHSLGLGTLWEANGLVVTGSGRYTGEFGLAAYREEFDSDASFVGVELAGGASSADAHWDQLFRSSVEEGDPEHPLTLSPLTGITDARGRDFAQDLMSATLDPDFGEPFLSNTSVQSLRDVGYDVVSHFPTTLCDLDADGLCNSADIDALTHAIQNELAPAGYDLSGDGKVDQADRTLWIETLVDTSLGDADLNGAVEFDDFLAVSANFGQSGQWSNGDFDGDGVVGFADFLLLAGRFGEMSHHPVSVPESIPWCAWLPLVAIAMSRSIAARNGDAV